jgi:hypothetical protein
MRFLDDIPMRFCPTHNRLHNNLFSLEFKKLIDFFSFWIHWLFILLKKKSFCLNCLSNFEPPNTSTSIGFLSLETISFLSTNRFDLSIVLSSHLQSSSYIFRGRSDLPFHAINMSHSKVPPLWTTSYHPLTSSQASEILHAQFLHLMRDH